MEGSKSPQTKTKKSRIMLADTDGQQYDNDDLSSESAPNQMVLFSSEAGDKGQDDLGENYSPLQKSTHTMVSNRGLPSIGAFTVQCAKCFKWRLIPTKEKYEEIREHIIEEPFECKRAREWRPTVTCDDPEDISQDGSRLWAIDKPNIAQPPAGWERQIRIRGEGGTKFADVYYTSPTGRKLRSLVEIDKYLIENPEYVAQGITLAQFSFQIPRPLRQDYVKKRPKIMSPSDESNIITPKSFNPEQVSPISWAAPPTNQEGEAGDESLGSVEVELIRKRKVGSSPLGEASSDHVRDELNMKLEDSQNGGDST